MKVAHVATRWVGEGESGDTYRADMPGPHGRMSVVGHQLVNLALGCPSPNIAVVRIEESRKKHEGYIDSLKSNLNQIVIEEWEDDWPVVQVASAAKLKNFLIRQEMDEDVAKVIADALDRTEALLGELEKADKRSRRRIEFGGIRYAVDSGRRESKDK